MTNAVDILKDIVSTHDLDTRYETAQCRNRIASLYLPLLGVAMEVLPYLHGYESDRDEQLINENVAMAIATSSVLSKSSTGDLQSQVIMQKKKLFVSPIIPIILDLMISSIIFSRYVNDGLRMF